MRKKMLALTVVGSVVLVVTGTAGAVSYFKATVSPNSQVKSGTTLTAKGTGALHSTAYYCVIAAYSTAVKNLSAPDTSTLKNVKSNSKGALTCKVKYKAFTAKDGKGKARHCPTTSADKKAHFKCGVAFADAATIGAKSESIAAFTPVK